MKLLQLRERQNLRKTASKIDKTKHTFHKTREEVKLIDTNSLNLAQMTLTPFLVKKKTSMVSYKTGHFWGSDAAAVRAYQTVDRTAVTGCHYSRV